MLQLELIIGKNLSQGGNHCLRAITKLRLLTITRLLYDMHSPRTSGGRGMAFGRIYSKDGTLVATTAQEGILRLSKREQEKRGKPIPTNSKL